jgi:hypothetical protein
MKPHAAPILTLLAACWAAKGPSRASMADLVREMEALSTAVEELRRSGTDEQWSTLERLLSAAGDWGESLTRWPHPRLTKLGSRAMSDAAQLAIRYDRIEMATWCAHQSILLDPSEAPHAFYVYGVGLYTTWLSVSDAAATTSATAASDPPREMVAALQTFARLTTDRAEIANAYFVMGVIQHRVHASDPRAAVRSYIAAVLRRPDPSA